MQANPDLAVTARANRAFLGRVVGFLAAGAEIRQYLDIGTGIPAASNTHEVAQGPAALIRHALSRATGRSVRSGSGGVAGSMPVTAYFRTGC